MVTCNYYPLPICSEKWRTSPTSNTFGTVYCTASYNTIQWVRYLIFIVLYCYLHSDLPGVEVVASTCVIVTNSPQTFHWVGYGFKLTIPQGSLPAGVDQCRLDIKASVAGQYQFPDNLQLVSGVFWVRSRPSSRFQRQLRVEIQHCTRMTSSTKLSFARAHCSQENLPYTFKQLEGRGSFTEHSSYGLLGVNHFSSLAIAAEGDVDRQYVASLYYLKADPRTVEIYFTINVDDEIHIAVSDRYLRWPWRSLTSGVL